MTSQIVVGVDGSAPAVAAVEWAAADAARRGLDLRIVHVCERWPHSEGTEHCAGALEAAADVARGLAGGVKVTTDLRAGNVVDELIGESATAGSLVLGSRGLGGFTGMVLGSVSTAVAGHAAGPVIVVRVARAAGPAHPPGEHGRAVVRAARAADHDAAEHGRVVVGYDGSEHARAAMRYAVEQARSRRAELHVVTAWQVPSFSPYAVGYGKLIEQVMQEEPRQARALVEPWRDEHPDLAITDEQPCEHPVAALTKAAETADLVVVGSRGLGGFASALLGSVSHAVLHHVTCPVAVVRPRG
ncbi:universal stress protein [Nonomuraea gerenzanensis]|uniref:Universal stress protein family n=1 Tax=Nonomuraea gerenzanensis TaxID=93944 RepID=A0A1M4E9V9_9ACTN|nr:universal stress protein [Nonomuraea gerenzanensis]UBU17856.1 universal stress protein [Nonomuraea gerenzanensis]SBO95645.1 Universal stress protein family [Nonomuraea gerenzanensis]